MSDYSDSQESPVVVQLDPGRTSIELGHSHETFIFINGDRISGYTSTVNDHFHVFDAPLTALNDKRIFTTEARKHKHVVFRARRGDKIIQGG